MNYKIVIFLLFFYGKSIESIGQTRPQLIKWYYWDRGFTLGIEHLTLSSDSIFFFSISAESGAYISKGTYKIKRNKLYLNSFDSTRTYPNFKMEFIKGDSANDVTIFAKDYFNNPFEGLSVRPISRKDSSFYNSSPIFADSLGQIIISKEENWSFYFLYQFDNSDAFLIDKSIQNYLLEKEVKQINVYIDFASSGGLDRGIKFMTLGNNIYKVKRGGLLL
jgi:hypothetical protein